MDEPIRGAGSPAALAAIDANLGAYCAALGANPEVTVRDDARFTWTISAARTFLLNGVLRAAIPPGGEDAAIAEAVAAYAARGRNEMRWVVGPRTRPPDLARHLARHGFAPRSQMPGMAADLAALPAAVPTPPGLAIEEVGDGGALAEWAGVVAPAHGHPPPFDHLITDAHAALGYGPGRPLRLVLARLSGRAVGAAAGYLAAGVVGVLWVATAAEARGQGIGAAVTLAPLHAAREAGYRVGILHATPLGLPVYRRLGFRERCTMDIWAREG